MAVYKNTPFRKVPERSELVLTGRGITRTSTRVWAAAEVHGVVCGERASLPDGAQASPHDGERASLPDGEQASLHDGGQASLPDGLQELRGGRYGLPDRGVPQGVLPEELFPASWHRREQKFSSFSKSFTFPVLLNWINVARQKVFFKSHYGKIQKFSLILPSKFFHALCS